MNSEIAAPPRPDAQRSAAREFLVWGAAILPFLALALWRLRDGPGLTGDDYGQYLMHAQALAQGRPYTDIGYIASPLRPGLGPATSPPGLPFILAAVYWLLGPNIMAMRLLILCFATVFVLVAGLYFARHCNREIGLGVTLLCALSPMIAHTSTQVLTDLPCTALIWLVIYLVDKPGRLTTQRIFAIGTLGILVMAFRVTAIALIPALMLFVVLRYREHGLRAVVPLMVWLAAGSILFLVLPLNTLSPVGLQRLAEWDPAFGLNTARKYWPIVFQSHLHPFPWATANDLFHIVTGVLMLVGLAAWIRTGPTRLAILFAFAYGAMLLLLPISTERYLWPLFPFFVFGLLNGVRVVAARVPAYSRRAPALALVFAVLLVPPVLAMGIAQPRRGGVMELPEVRQIVRAVRHSGISPRVIFFKPRALAWETGIPAMGVINGSPECMISEMALRRITHSISGNLEGGMRPAAQRNLTRLEEGRPDIFVEVMRTNHFIMYHVRVSDSAANAARAACVSSVN